LAQTADDDWDFVRDPGQKAVAASATFDSSGAVTTSCVVETDGRLTHCVVETERPAGAGFGQAAIDGARTARITASGDAPPPAAPSVVTYRTTFFLQ
jgi:hypothetical protein